LGDKKIDFCFIDGDHTYEGVRKDFEMYSRLVRNGGIVAFHDIFGPNSSVCQVQRFWKEFKMSERYTCHEIRYDDAKRPCGIGVVYL
jgi:predicted O-methyltransferase YrrM